MLQVCVCVCVGGPREVRGEGAVCVLFFCVVGCGGHPQAIGLGRGGWVPRPDPQDSPAALGRAVTAELGRLQVDPMGPFVVGDVRDVLMGLGVPVQLQAPILRSLFVTFPILSVVCVSSLSRMLHTRILIGPSSPSAYPFSLAAPPHPSSSPLRSRCRTLYPSGPCDGSFLILAFARASIAMATSRGRCSKIRCGSLASPRGVLSQSQIPSDHSI